MNVNSTHFEYEASLAGWSRARAVIAGEDAVKGTADNFLPRLDAQSNDDCAAYGLPATTVVPRTFRCVLASALLFRDKVARQETCQNFIWPPFCCWLQKAGTVAQKDATSGLGTPRSAKIAC